MKKLLALAVVFALATVGLFAMDVGGEVIGTVQVVASDTSEATDGVISSSASLDRIRISGAGGNDNFGAWYRLEGLYDGGVSLLEAPDWSGAWVYPGGAFGHVWWSPISQFKLIVGSNGGDGFYEKAGMTTWMFYQRASDTGVVDPGNAWYSAYHHKGDMHLRHAFYGGDSGHNNVKMEIKPLDMLGINIVLPFFDGGDKTYEVFGNLTAQVDLNLDFGNIALTFDNAFEDDGIDGTVKGGDKNVSDLFVYFNLAAVENLSLDVGAHLTFDNDSGEYPVAVGLGVKYDVSDSFGLKLRTMAEFGGPDKEFDLIADLMPYVGINDNMKAFFSLGLTLNAPDSGDSITGFHFNPFIWVGEEWGPAFWAGFKLWTNGVDGSDAVINWEIPIAIGVSF